MPDPPSAHFAIDLDRKPGIVTLALSGELDLKTAPRLRSYLGGLARSHHTRLVIDLRELTSIDSAGINALLAANRHAQRDGWTLEIVKGKRNIQRVFGRVGLGDALPFVNPPRSPPRVETHGAGCPRGLWASQSPRWCDDASANRRRSR